MSPGWVLSCRVLCLVSLLGTHLVTSILARDPAVCKHTHCFQSCEGKRLFQAVIRQGGPGGREPQVRHRHGHAWVGLGRR